MKKVAVVFGGYGTQHVGMGKDLYDHYRIMQEYFEEAYNCQNLNFVKLCFASSDAELGQINNAYQSLFLYGSALFVMLKEMGVTVDAVTGFDIGYYAAVFGAGSITFPDGLYYLNKFAGFYEAYIQEHPLKAIEIVGLQEEDVQKYCAKFFRKRKPIYISLQKDNQTFVVAGYKETVENVELYIKGKFEQQEIKVKEAPIEPGLYSELMKPVYDQIKLYLEKIDIKDPVTPLISPSAQQLATALEIRSDLVGHLLYTFNYLHILKNLYKYDILIEVSAKGKLAEMLKKYYPEKEIISFSTKQDIEKIKELLGDQFKELERVS